MAVPVSSDERLQREYWMRIAAKLKLHYVGSGPDTVTVMNPDDHRQQQLHRWFLEKIGVA